MLQQGFALGTRRHFGGGQWGVLCECKWAASGRVCWGHASCSLPDSLFPIAAGSAQLWLALAAAEGLGISMQTGGTLQAAVPSLAADG